MFSRSDLEKAVAHNTTISGVARELLHNDGKGYRDLIKREIVAAGLDIKHFTGFMLGNSNSQKYSLNEILVKNSTYTNNGNLKDRLLNAGLVKYKCDECGLSKWRGKPLTLQLDHKNGDRHDNRLENLRLMCPNCHSQTSTFCGKNVKIKPEKRTCPGCSSVMVKGRANRKLCWDCHITNRKANPKPKQSKQRPTKIKWPNPINVRKMVDKYGYVGTGKKLGVSDNAVHKFLKRSSPAIG